ncbi:hypothetical protein Poly30_33970 [Planctomycetes bacterium Poly30]|uniref:Lipoprotein n=1 Tax=Saltatorellus ferox TaxID=2528018 RepID=A0A518EUX6_9BACT|nr:hypothetical protein Poly30_33970 [Planctomycetes bacterium Poly30]
MLNSRCATSVLFVSLALPLISCGGSESAPAKEPAPESASVEVVAPLTAYWSDAPLGDAKEVRDIRESVKDGEKVVLRGTLQDFGELATFRLVDDGLKDCTEMADDGCSTPWDFCCADPDELERWTVNVEFLEDGMPADWSLHGQKDLERLTEVVVAGTLRRDEAGNLRLEAERMSVQ